MDRPAPTSRAHEAIAEAGDDASAFPGFVAALIDGPDATPGVASPGQRSELHELYPPDARPLWLDGDGHPTSNMRQALTVLSQAGDEGLDPTDYYPGAGTAPTPSPQGSRSSAQDRARVDVAVSAGMLRYLRDVHLGRVDPRSIGLRLGSPPDRHDFAAMLLDAVARQRVTQLVADLRPPFAQYEWLRTMLPRYRALAADPAFVAVPSVTRSVHPGELHAGVGVLRNELIAFGDLVADGPAAPSTRYEGALVEGVRHFQIRHGLEADGILGTHTIAALRVPPAARVRQIELALERLRWLPHLAAERVIALNIPMFRLWAWDAAAPKGTPRVGMDVIVGRALRTQTPVLTAQLNEVIFRPYWNVPRSILLGEVLPQIERDSDYLQREGMEIVRGASDRAERVELTPEALDGLRQGALRVRQRPGPKNSLGLIKFDFPNREEVYLHGTPAQALFARQRRDFSHGCLRVADPVALAEWILRDRPEWTRTRIAAATSGTETIRVKLPRPIQVILFYTTAAVMPEDGTIHFAEDIYGHDARLARAIDGLNRTR